MQACVKYLKTKGFLDAKNDDSETLLHVAAKTNNCALADVLIDSGANINSVTDAGETPLLAAVCEESVQLVKLLCARGADVNRADYERGSPLHYAVAGGIMPIITALMKHGANVNALDNFQETPLHHAVSDGNLDIIKLFLKAGADIDQHSECGSPLYQAISYGRIDAFNLLVELGADFDLMNPDGFDVSAALADLRVTIDDVDAEDGSDWESDDGDDDYLRDPTLFDKVKARVDEILAIREKAKEGNVDFFIDMMNNGKIPPKAQVFPLLSEPRRNELTEWGRVKYGDMRGLYAFNYHGSGDHLADPPGPISAKLCEFLLLPAATRQMFYS